MPFILQIIGLVLAGALLVSYGAFSKSSILVRILAGLVGFGCFYQAYQLIF